MSSAAVSDRQLRLVIVASTLGTIIEWYDFYIFGSLATILSAHFFPKENPVAAFLETVAIFTIGFLIRPLGAFVFGRIGDLIGRKYTFLVTLTGMGLSTALIGVVPSYAQIGIAAPIILFLLRIIQGLTLGGEYGGAITYVAEHAPDERRGYWTGWLQTSPSAGLLVSLAVVIGTRLGLGDEAFTAWGWRIPFLVSFILVAISFYIRMKLHETPIFQDLRRRGATTRNPWRESFTGPNLKPVLIATVIILGQGVVWYSSQFWALFFLQTVKGLDVLTSSTIVGIALVLAVPFFVVFARLSDLVGRKPIMLLGMGLAAATYYPLYSALGRAAQPGQVDYVTSVAIVWALVMYVAMVYGPTAAFLAEFFPSRIRYTSVSVPYHIGNGWGGGLVPFVTSAIWASTKNLGLTLLYPILVPAVACLLGLFIMPQTHRVSLWQEVSAGEATAGQATD
ncbi:MAG: MHS family MFS transporter [Symbiobacteriaceae bacterium]|nr:MAG: MFS transporter [Bacillota bacterium]